MEHPETTKLYDTHSENPKENLAEYEKLYALVQARGEHLHLDRVKANIMQIVQREASGTGRSDQRNSW